MTMLLSIAAGGAVGAVSRWWVSNQVTHWTGHGFPWGTFAVNIIGSFLLGILAETLARVWDPSPELRDFIRVGFLGAFTTFSTFSLDAYTLLLEHRQVVAGLGYILGSVVMGVLALLAGLAAARLALP